MFQIQVGLSDDKKTATVQTPSMSAPQSFNAQELSEFINHLAWLRASMEPQHPQVDLAPGTPTSSVPAVRYQVTEDDVPGQCRLYFLHPGYGWLHIHLPGEAVTKISKDAQIFLQSRPSTQ